MWPQNDTHSGSHASTRPSPSLSIQSVHAVGPGVQLELPPEPPPELVLEPESAADPEELPPPRAPPPALDAETDAPAPAPAGLPPAPGPVEPTVTTDVEVDVPAPAPPAPPPPPVPGPVELTKEPAVEISVPPVTAVRGDIHSTTSAGECWQRNPEEGSG